MPIKWKTKNKNLKPNIVDKIEKMGLVSSNGEVSFSGGIEFEFAQLALETMIEGRRMC
jgi:predicted regulator of amino acid metabolism with ACT domain